MGRVCLVQRDFRRQLGEGGRWPRQQVVVGWLRSVESWRSVEGWGGDLYAKGGWLRVGVASVEGQ